jgi:phage tail-like protein
LRFCLPIDVEAAPPGARLQEETRASYRTMGRRRRDRTERALMPTAQSRRAYSAAHFVLELDQHEIAGFFRSVEGGGVKAEILTYQTGDSPALWRQLSRPQYEDIKLEVGMSMAESFYKWIEAFFTGKVVRKSGAIVAGDFHYRERARREFSDALISELSFPKLDATDRNACYMGVTLVPERVRFMPGTMRSLEPYIGDTSQKLWTPANFELTIDGFEDACRRVTQVDGFTIKQEILEYRVGHRRDSMRVPGILEFPNLTFSVPEADAQPFIQHFTKHVIEGVPQPATRIGGGITLKDHRGSDLCSIALAGIDIASITPDKSDAQSDDIKQVKIEIAVESMKFTYASSDPASQLE